MSSNFWASVESSIHFPTHGKALNENVIISLEGTGIQFFNIKDGTVTTFPGSFSAFTVSRSLSTIAVAVKDVESSVVIYQYPSLQVSAQFSMPQQFAASKISSLSFSSDGSRLAVFTGGSDYRLVIFDTTSGSVIEFLEPFVVPGLITHSCFLENDITKLLGYGTHGILFFDLRASIEKIYCRLTNQEGVGVGKVICCHSSTPVNYMELDSASLRSTLDETLINYSNDPYSQFVSPSNVMMISALVSDLRGKNSWKKAVWLNDTFVIGLNQENSLFVFSYSTGEVVCSFTLGEVIYEILFATGGIYGESGSSFVEKWRHSGIPSPQATTVSVTSELLCIAGDDGNVYYAYLPTFLSELNHMMLKKSSQTGKNMKGFAGVPKVPFGLNRLTSTSRPNPLYNDTQSISRVISRAKSHFGIDLTDAEQENLNNASLSVITNELFRSSQLSIHSFVETEFWPRGSIQLGLSASGFLFSLPSQISEEIGLFGLMKKCLSLYDTSTSSSSPQGTSSAELSFSESPLVRAVPATIESTSSDVQFVQPITSLAISSTVIPRAPNALNELSEFPPVQLSPISLLAVVSRCRMSSERAAPVSDVFKGSEFEYVVSIAMPPDFIAPTDPANTPALHASDTTRSPASVGFVAQLPRTYCSLSLPGKPCSIAVHPRFPLVFIGLDDGRLLVLLVAAVPQGADKNVAINLMFVAEDVFYSESCPLDILEFAPHPPHPLSHEIPPELLLGSRGTPEALAAVSHALSLAQLPIHVCVGSRSQCELFIIDASLLATHVSNAFGNALDDLTQDNDANEYVIAHCQLPRKPTSASYAADVSFGVFPDLDALPARLSSTLSELSSRADANFGPTAGNMVVGSLNSSDKLILPRLGNEIFLSLEGGLICSLAVPLFVGERHALRQIPSGAVADLSPTLRTHGNLIISDPNNNNIDFIPEITGLSLPTVCSAPHILANGILTVFQQLFPGSDPARFEGFTLPPDVPYKAFIERVFAVVRHAFPPQVLLLSCKQSASVSLVVVDQPAALLGASIPTQPPQLRECASLSCGSAELRSIAVSPLSRHCSAFLLQTLDADALFSLYAVTALPSIGADTTASAVVSIHGLTSINLQTSYPLHFSSNSVRNNTSFHSVPSADNFSFYVTLPSGAAILLSVQGELISQLQHTALTNANVSPSFDEGGNAIPDAPAHFAARFMAAHTSTATQLALRHLFLPSDTRQLYYSELEEFRNRAISATGLALSSAETEFHLSSLRAHCARARVAARARDSAIALFVPLRTKMVSALSELSLAVDAVVTANASAQRLLQLAPEELVVDKAAMDRARASIALSAAARRADDKKVIATLTAATALIRSSLPTGSMTNNAAEPSVLPKRTVYALTDLVSVSSLPLRRPSSRIIRQTAHIARLRASELVAVAADSFTSRAPVGAAPPSFGGFLHQKCEDGLTMSTDSKNGGINWILLLGQLFPSLFPSITGGLLTTNALENVVPTNTSTSTSSENAAVKSTASDNTSGSSKAVSNDVLQSIYDEFMKNLSQSKDGAFGVGADGAPLKSSEFAEFLLDFFVKHGPALSSSSSTKSDEEEDMTALALLQLVYSPLSVRTGPQRRAQAVLVSALIRRILSIFNRAVERLFSEREAVVESITKKHSQLFDLLLESAAYSSSSGSNPSLTVSHNISLYGNSPATSAASPAGNNQAKKDAGVNVLFAPASTVRGNIVRLSAADVASVSIELYRDRRAGGEGPITIRTTPISASGSASVSPTGTTANVSNNVRFSSPGNGGSSPNRDSAFAFSPGGQGSSSSSTALSSKVLVPTGPFHYPLGALPLEGGGFIILDPRPVPLFPENSPISEADVGCKRYFSAEELEREKQEQGRLARQQKELESSVAYRAVQEMLGNGHASMNGSSSSKSAASTTSAAGGGAAASVSTASGAMDGTSGAVGDSTLLNEISRHRRDVNSAVAALDAKIRQLHRHGRAVSALCRVLALYCIHLTSANHILTHHSLLSNYSIARISADAQLGDAVSRQYEVGRGVLLGLETQLRAQVALSNAFTAEIPHILRLKSWFLVDSSSSAPHTNIAGSGLVVESAAEEPGALVDGKTAKLMASVVRPHTSTTLSSFLNGLTSEAQAEARSLVAQLAALLPVNLVPFSSANITLSSTINTTGTSSTSAPLAEALGTPSSEATGLLARLGALLGPHSDATAHNHGGEAVIPTSSPFFGHSDVVPLAQRLRARACVLDYQTRELERQRSDVASKLASIGLVFATHKANTESGLRVRNGIETLILKKREDFVLPLRVPAETLNVPLPLGVEGDDLYQLASVDASISTGPVEESNFTYFRFLDTSSTSNHGLPSVDTVSAAVAAAANASIDAVEKYTRSKKLTVERRYSLQNPKRTAHRALLLPRTTLRALNAGVSARGQQKLQRLEQIASQRKSLALQLWSYQFLHKSAENQRSLLRDTQLLRPSGPVAAYLSQGLAACTSLRSEFELADRHIRQLKKKAINDKAHAEAELEKARGGVRSAEAALIQLQETLAREEQLLAQKEEDLGRLNGKRDALTLRQHSLESPSLLAEEADEKIDAHSFVSASDFSQVDFLGQNVLMKDREAQDRQNRSEAILLNSKLSATAKKNDAIISKLKEELDRQLKRTVPMFGQ